MRQRNHTGAQTEVLKAVCRGHRYAPQIAQATGIPLGRVRTPLRRLRVTGHIRVVKERSEGAYKAYELENIGVLLADIW